LLGALRFWQPYLDPQLLHFSPCYLPLPKYEYDSGKIITPENDRLFFGLKRFENGKTFSMPSSKIQNLQNDQTGSQQ